MGNQVGASSARRAMPQHAAQKIARKCVKGKGLDAINKLPQSKFYFLQLFSLSSASEVRGFRFTNVSDILDIVPIGI